MVATYLRPAGVVPKTKSQTGSLQACLQMKEVDLKYSYEVQLAVSEVHENIG